MNEALEYRSELCMKIFDFLSGRDYCDVEIKVMEHSFYCHKVVLAAACPLLRGIIQKKLAQLSTKTSRDDFLVLQMDFLSPEAVESLLRFLYTGECDIVEFELNAEFALMVQIFCDPNHVASSLEEVEKLYCESDASITIQSTSHFPIGMKRNCETDGEYIIQVNNAECNKRGGRFQFKIAQRRGTRERRNKISLPQSPPFLCPCQNCGKIFETRERLRSHYRHNHGEKKFKCRQCPLRFLYPKDLRCHIRTHTGEKPYVCEICGKAFAQMGSMSMHARIHGKPKKTNIVVHPCSDCKKLYCRKQTHNLNIENFDLSSLLCPNVYCAKKFASVKSLRKHIKNDICSLGQSSCAKCGTKFDSMLRLERHVGQVHCTHKKKQRRFKEDRENCEVELKEPAETSVELFSGSPDETLDHVTALSFEQSDDMLELYAEIVTEEIND